MDRYAIILAAGQGKRIKSNLPKVLHKACGKEMVNHVIDTMREAGIDDVNVIIGKGAKLVQDRTSSRNVTYSLQEEQLGTGHAVKCAKASDMKIATESFDKLQEIKLKLADIKEYQLVELNKEIETWKNSNPIVKDEDINDLIKRN